MRLLSTKLRFVSNPFNPSKTQGGQARRLKQVKAPADKPDNLGLIPGTHRVRGEEACTLSSDVHSWAVALKCTRTQ